MNGTLSPKTRFIIYLSGACILLVLLISRVISEDEFTRYLDIVGGALGIGSLLYAAKNTNIPGPNDSAADSE